MSKVWWNCDNCNKKTKSPHQFKGSFLCYKCYKKRIIQIPREVTLFQAKNKIYEVKPRNKKNTSGICNFPRILIGTKFKIKVL